jgi:hypothetical protein
VSNMQVFNHDIGGIEVGYGKHRDELLVFAGDDTFAAGTLLARRRVAIAVVASAITGTGTGTVTAASVVPGTVVPLVGAYVLRNILVVADGGVWQLEDPNGAIIASGLRMTVGAGAATPFEAGGLAFTITDGGTNFALGDTATLTVAADGKLVPFDPAGAAGAQIPCAVLTYEVTKVGAGNLPIRALIGGEVNQNRLIIDADGDGDNITTDHIETLRTFGIVAVPVKQQSVLDNQ